MRLARIASLQGTFEEDAKHSDRQRLYGLTFFAQGVIQIPGESVTVQIVKRSELHILKVMPKPGSSNLALLDWRRTGGHGRAVSVG